MQARAGEIDITGITPDSRQVKPGFLFAALAGSRTDGARFAADAVARGAAAVLASPEAAAGLGGLAVPVVVDANPRRRLAELAARFYGPQPKHVAAVTGTNGKTSVAWFTRQIWRGRGLPAAALGTLGVVTDLGIRPLGNTTPDPVELHATLAELKGVGVDHVAMEASSHGLDQHRLDGVVLEAAAFTNLTQDHYDYHATPEAYRDAKFRLFAALLPPGGTAVLNADVPEYEALFAIARGRGHRVLAYGRAGADLALDGLAPDGGGQVLDIRAGRLRRTVRLPVAGAFQAMNALAAVGLAVGSGIALVDALDALPGLVGVPGRLQEAAVLGNGARCFVDYAHTPDALANVLGALRPMTKGRLVVVFGCGGDRDPLKRPLMGGVAAALADRAIVTDDNPRSEDPASIRRQVLAGCPGAVEVGDRAQAIATAIADLRADDVLVVAGKGHEQGQIVGQTIVPFDDVAAVRRAVATLKGVRA